MAYDFEAMKQDGFTEEDISNAIGIDYVRMKQDGFTDEDISSAVDMEQNADLTNTIAEENTNAVYMGSNIGQTDATIEIKGDPLQKELSSIGITYDKKASVIDAKINAITNSPDYTPEYKDVLIKGWEAKKAELEQSKVSDENKLIDKMKPVPSATDKKEDVNKNFFDEIADFSNNLREGIQGFETELGRMASPTLKLALHTVEKIGNSIGQTAENMVNPIANIFGMDFDFYEKNAKAIRAEGIRLNQSIDPFGKAIIAPTKAFDAVTSLVVPLRIKNNFDLTMTEGLLGYALEYGNTGNISEAIKSGIYSAGISSATVGIIDEIASVFSKFGTSKPLEYLWNKHSLELIEASGLGKDATKKQVLDAIEQDWLKIMQGSSSNETKIRAIIDRLGQTGATYKAAVEEVSNNASGVTVRTPKSLRVEDVRANVSNNTEEVANALAKDVGYSKAKSSDLANKLSDNPDEVAKIQKKLKQGDIKELYGDFIKATKSKYNGTYNVNKESMTNMKSSLEAKISKNGVLSSTETNLANALDGELTMDKLISIKKEATTLAMNSKDNVIKLNASKLKSEAESILKENMSPNDFKLFKSMDEEYTNMSAITSKKDINKLGVQLIKLANGKQTLESTIAYLNKIEVGEIDMKAIEKVIGSNNVAKLEKSIISNMMSGKVDDVSWGVISKSLEKIGFISKEGKQLKESIAYMDKVFSADNHSLLNVLRIPKESDSAALTADILQKVKYATASGIWQQIKRRFYITKEYEDIRAVRDIADILTNKNIKIRGLNIDKAESYEIVRDSMKEAYKKQIKDMGSKVSEEEIDNAVSTDMSRLGFDSAYGGKATSSTDKGVTGNKSLGETLQGKTKQVEEAPKPTDKSGMGFSSEYGGKATKSTDKGVNIGDTPADRLIPVVKPKPVDKQGGYKIAEVGKTTKGTTATAEQKAYFNRFMDDIANPEVSVKNEDFTKVYNMVKNDKDIMYAQSPEKQKLWNELFGALSQAKQQGTVKPALRRYITERLSQYHDMINKGK